MRKLTGAVFLSLDGVMQAPGGPEEDPTGGFKFGGWTFPFWDDSADPAMDKYLIGPEYDLLLGKRTYDIFAAYWPYNRDNPVGEKFQRIDKYVLTHSDEPLTWDNSSKLSGETAAAVSDLKKSDGRDLLIQGSSTLYPPLLAAGLIDRLILMRFPVLLGAGKRIFDGSERPGAFKLVDHLVSDTGVIFATYEPAGDVPTGSFVSDNPSEAELERRKKMGEGSW
jgi:dihydrofolate reductase